MRSSEWNAKNLSGAHSIESVSICHLYRRIRSPRVSKGRVGQRAPLTVGLLTQMNRDILPRDESSGPQSIRSRTTSSHA